MQLNEDEKKEAEKRIHRSACFQRAFSGEDGEFTLKEIDVLTNYKNNTFSPDPYQGAYNAGQRSIAVFIHNCIDQDVEKARKILDAENKE